MELWGLQKVLERHLDECAERYKAVAEGMERNLDLLSARLQRLEDRIEFNRQEGQSSRRRIYAILNAIAGVVLLSLAGAVWQIISKHLI